MKPETKVKVIIATGIAFYIASLAVGYLNQITFGLKAQIAIILLGLLVGSSASADHRNLWTDLSMTAGLLFILGLYLKPWTIVGSQIILEKTNFFILAFLIFAALERELINSVLHLLKKPEGASLGLLAQLLALILFWPYISPVIEKWFWVVPIFLIIWWIYLYKRFIPPLMNYLATGDWPKKK